MKAITRYLAILGALTGALFVALFPELAWRHYARHYHQMRPRPPLAADVSEFWSGGGDVL